MPTEAKNNGPPSERILLLKGASGVRYAWNGEKKSIEISICHYGRRPRLLAAPPLTLNLPLMASKETLEQVKNLLKQELSPINAILDGLNDQTK